MHFFPSLGYPEADDHHLFRSEEGIGARGKRSYPAVALAHYPTKVTFASFKAIEKIESLSHRVAIEVFANLKSGKRVGLFTINSPFFQNEMRPEFPVVCLVPSDSDRSAISSWIDGDDFVSSFSAQLKTEYEVYDFVFKLLTKNVPQKQEFRPGESINLRIDANPDWDLSIENHVWVSLSN